MIRAFVLLLALTAVAATVHVPAPDVRVGPFLQDAEPTSIWVVWETTGDAPSRVSYGASKGTRKVAEGESIPGQAGSRIHHVQLTGLKPGTTHYYSIDAKGDRGRTFRFRTPAPRERVESFRFAVYSDTQSGPDAAKHTEVINEGVIDFIKSEFGRVLPDELAFSLVPGDLVNTGSSYGQWKDQFFDEEQNLAQHVPLYPVPGTTSRTPTGSSTTSTCPRTDPPASRSTGGSRTTGTCAWSASTPTTPTAFPSSSPGSIASWKKPPRTRSSTSSSRRCTTRTRRRPGPRATPPSPAKWCGGWRRSPRPPANPRSTSSATPTPTSAARAVITSLWVDVGGGRRPGVVGEYPNADYPEFQKVFMDWGFVLMEVEDGDNPSFRMRRVSRGNQFDPKDNAVIDDITVRHTNGAPEAPRPLAPKSGATGVSADHGVLRGSPFRDVDGDTHLASHFQVTARAGDYSSPVRDEWFRFENWFAPPDAKGRETGYFSVDTREGKVRELELGLDPFTTYHWRVRYRDSGLAWSEWSEEGSFTTGAAAIGAACLPEGGCVEMREGQALALGADFQGVGTTCANAGCPTYVTLFEETFEGVELREPSMEPGSGPSWSPSPPEGWITNRDEMTGGGVEEWRGWSFAKKDFWLAASGDQGRGAFALGDGVVAVADPDEWHDAPTDKGSEGGFLAVMTTPEIPLTGAAPGTLHLAFDSTWNPDEPSVARVFADFDEGGRVQVLEWHSKAGHENFKPAAPNERVTVAVDQPARARSVRLVFQLGESNNDWYWAVDDIRLFGEERR